jgi:hypothetical protein
MQQYFPKNCIALFPLPLYHPVLCSVVYCVLKNENYAAGMHMNKATVWSYGHKRRSAGLILDVVPPVIQPLAGMWDKN